VQLFYNDSVFVARIASYDCKSDLRYCFLL